MRGVRLAVKTTSRNQDIDSLDELSPGGNGAAQPAIDVKSLHAKIGELTAGERFFGRSARQSRFAEHKA